MPSKKLYPTLEYQMWLDGYSVVGEYVSDALTRLFHTELEEASLNKRYTILVLARFSYQRIRAS
jgi:hypothetical protein